VESGEWRLTIEDWRLKIGDHLWRLTIRHHKALSAISNDEIESVIEIANGYRRVQFGLCSFITHHSSLIASLTPTLNYNSNDNYNSGQSVASGDCVACFKI
jgi:hypothetical protein